LEYVSGQDTSDSARPVMVHRAILGSVERMTAILTEHFAGKWPFWLSPRQVLVIPISHTFDDYATTVQSRMHDAGLYVDVDVGPDTLNKKIRTGQLHQYNFIIVLGIEEQTNHSVNIRNRDDTSKQSKGEAIDLDECIVKMLRLKNERRLVNSLDD